MAFIVTPKIAPGYEWGDVRTVEANFAHLRVSSTKSGVCVVTPDQVTR